MTLPGATYPDLKDLPVLITGGGSGIGAALVEAFAAQGSKVGFLEISAQAAQQTLERVKAGGGSALCEITDLRDISALPSAIQKLSSRLGAFRVLVNNAGDDERHAWAAIDQAYWDDRFAVNVRHQFFAAQAVAPGMTAAGGGSIINMGSTSWMFGAAGLIAYTTAKSAIEGLTKSLARELGESDIRVNSIAPGWVLTPKQTERAQRTDPSKFAAHLARQAIKSHLEPDDIAKLALWLASSESRRCTGQTFILDGGFL